MIKEEKKLILGNELPFPTGTIAITQPNHVGCYKIGGEQGLHFYLTIKPKWFHRKMMKLCLGWEWIDNK
jgi:hypothetical protein